jgi:hypothetical protein
MRGAGAGAYIPLTHGHHAWVVQVLAHDIDTLADDRSEGSNLTTAYKQTKAVWAEVYRGEVFDIPGSGYIPPSVLHPVAVQMGKAQKYFGLPVVQRTGAVGSGSWTQSFRAMLLNSCGHSSLMPCQQPSSLDDMRTGADPWSMLHCCGSGCGRFTTTARATGQVVGDVAFCRCPVAWCGLHT